jgi:predicted N-formylglutamate amidohydrolase
MPAVVVSCEHASARVPEGVDLGVPDEALASHVAWDEGAAIVAQAVAASLGAPIFLGVYTRLFVDLNRFATNPAVIPAIAFGTPVPGNASLTEVNRRERLDLYHTPYREAVAGAVAAGIAARGACVHLSMHSFTDAPLFGVPRDYDSGILFDPDRYLDRVVAAALIDGLSRRGIGSVANQPYTGTGDGLTTALRMRHGDREYAGIEVETSHRVVRAPGGLDRMVAGLLGSWAAVQLAVSG